MSAVMLCNFLRIQCYRKFDIVLLRSFAEIGWSKEQCHKCSWLQIYKTKWTYKLSIGAASAPLKLPVYVIYIFIYVNLISQDVKRTVWVLFLPFEGGACMQMKS